MGVLFVILTSATFPFRNEILSVLYPKPRSFASGEGGVPSVDLKVVVDGTAYDGILNTPEKGGTYTLFWETKGNPSSCIGRVWGISASDDSFKGPKDVSGGSFTTAALDKNNPYVYTIDCQNENGDSEGDSVTINVGAASAKLDPFIVDFVVTTRGDNLSVESPIAIQKGENVAIEWKSLNTATPYSICIATGSWPTGYRNLGGSTIGEEFIVADKKVYNYTIYCSNESSYTQKGVSFLVN